MQIATFAAAARRAAVLFVVLPLLLTACSPRDRSSVRQAADAASAADEPPQYVFGVDPHLLGDRYTLPGGGLSLKPPAGWQPVDDDTRRVVERQIRDSVADGPVSGSLIELFVDSDTGSALTILRLDGELSPREIGRALEQAEAADKAVFRHAGMEIVQIRSVAAGAVAFSLITRAAGETPVLLQYVITEAADDRAMRAVESSIGSLRTE
ncbi:MAG: hypothetical protein EA384_07505 [Spirochaetaceae bacterium]|nr:MAG: hypothetical protein EA384_07505 [Spirochaetaceae bacterium]